MSEPKKTQGKTTAKGSAKVPFKKAAGSSPKKATPRSPSGTPTKGSFKKETDYSNRLIIEALKPGLLIMYPKKATRDEQPYFKPEWDKLKGDAIYKDMLGLNDIVSRKGKDGMTYRGQSLAVTDYAWQQALVITGVESEGDLIQSKDVRRTYADNWIEKINLNNGLYQYPTEMKFGTDRTRDAPRPASACLLDETVIELMIFTNPDYADSVAELAEFPDIMSQFWHDFEYGKAAMEAYSPSSGDFHD